MNCTYISGTHKLQSVTDAVATTPEDWDAVHTQFAYGGNGNVVEMLENGQPAISSITYDHRNLPVRIVKGDGTEIVYRYNAGGQRILSKLAARRRNITLWMATRRWRCTGTVRCRKAIPLGKYWNILANGVVGRRDATGNKFYYLPQRVRFAKSSFGQHP